MALAYPQVIELFLTCGAGYRVAAKLVAPYMGLISDCALILDYVLTIAICIASGVDAVEEVTRLCEEINREFPHSVFFTSKRIFTRITASRACCTTGRHWRRNGACIWGPCRW